MLLVGLGNPGSQYENTRHNIGFMVIDQLIKRFGAKNISSSSFEGELYKKENLLLLKPQTFMNLSGRSVSKVKNFYKDDDIVVIHDDLDLPFGTLRFKTGGGHGGHNGLKSIDSMVGNLYKRVRMGIGKPIHKSEVASFVLSGFSTTQSTHLDDWIGHTCDAIEFMVDHSLEDTSSKYSIKKFQLQ